MQKISLFLLIALVALGLIGCYQIHSDDDLRTIPVTNNPNIVPGHNKGFHSAPM